MRKMRKIIAVFVGLVLAISFLGLTPTVFASYKNYTGTYTGMSKQYDMTCPSVYYGSSEVVTIKIKVKTTGKYTGTMKFKSDVTNYGISGKIKSGKITLHYTGLNKKYDYSGTIRNRKIVIIGHNDDMLDTVNGMRCPNGWKQKMSLKKK